MSDAEHVLPGRSQVAARAEGPNTPRTPVPSGSVATVPSAVQWPVDVSTIVSPRRA